MYVSIRMAAVWGSFGFLFVGSTLFAQAIAPRNDAGPRQIGPVTAGNAGGAPAAGGTVQNGVDPRIAGAQALEARSPQAPSWFPQPAEHQKYVADVLKFWEQSSAKIERYQCNFVRYEYDPVWGPKPDPKTGKSPATRISYGQIKYSKPDKGSFKVTKMTHYTPPAAPGDKAGYLPKEGESGEHWVCDGKSVFEFDHEKKKLVEHQLPPEMHGKAIVDGPLPFLFGAEAAKIQQRYWVGVFTPPGAKGEYWLEAWPKFREDAKNYKKVEIIIDETDFLPMAIQIYDHNGSATNPSSTVLTFEKREINFDLAPGGKLLNPLQLFAKEFIEPSTPFGYKKETIRFDAASGQQQAAQPRGTQASRMQLPLRQTK